MSISICLYLALRLFLFLFFFFFFFNDTATTEIYTLSLHDALPILFQPARIDGGFQSPQISYRLLRLENLRALKADRKSTRLNSSHVRISYAVFCLKKKKHTTRFSTP